MEGRDQINVSVKFLTENAKMPLPGSKYAAGSDVFAARSVVIPARGRELVPTDIAIAIDNPNYYIRVAPRSGLGLKGLDVGAGVVDYDYRGAVGVVVYNHTDAPFEIKQHDRVAQLIFERIAQPNFNQVIDLPTTERGAGGFGSTGQA